MVTKIKISDINPNTLMIVGGIAIFAYVYLKGAKGAGQAIGGATIDLVDGVLEGAWDATGLNKVEPKQVMKAVANNGTPQGILLNAVTKIFDWSVQLPQKVFGQ